MAKKKKSKFGANVVADVERRKKEGSAYGYLNLPKGLSMFKESEGRLRLDIIPYTVTDKNHRDFNPDVPGVAEVGEPWYKRPILVHRAVGVNNEAVICPKTIGKKCPICEHRDKQFKDGMDKDDVVQKAKLRNLYLVIPKGHKEYYEYLHLWDMSDYLFQQKLDDELGEDPEQGIFPDPEQGKTIKVRFSEEKFGKNKYYETSRIDFEERDDQYEEAIIEDSPNLDEIFTILTYKQLEAMFLEIEEDDLDPSEEEDEQDVPFEEDTPKRKKKEIKSKKQKKEKLDEAEDEKEELDEKPKRSKKSKEKKEKSDKNPCPFKHKFGKDWDEYDDCDDCDKFDDCGKSN